MTYVRQSQEEYEAPMKAQQLKALKRQARPLGLAVIENTSGSVATAVAASAQAYTSQRGDQKRCVRGGGAQQGRAKTHTPSESSVAVVGERARRGEPGTEITSVY